MKMQYDIKRFPGSPKTGHTHIIDKMKAGVQRGDPRLAKTGAPRLLPSASARLWVGARPPLWHRPIFPLPRLG